jgi:hypothetical protein
VYEFKQVNFCAPELLSAETFAWRQAVDECRSRCAAVGVVDNGYWGFGPYIEARDYLTGYSYASSLAFAVVAFRRYREKQMCSARNFALGGVTLSGFLAVSGCFLLGCCGSPMLGVYLSLFGTSFLPWAKPLIAGLMTTVMIAVSYWWMRIRSRKEESSASCCTLADDGVNKVSTATTSERQPRR